MAGRDEPMTVIVTMAGMGSRFAEAGYTVPKYRIMARGRSLLEWSMDSLQAFTDEPFIFACLESENPEWIQATAQICGVRTSRIVTRRSLSGGQAETAYDVLSHAEPESPLWIFNIDTHITPMSMRPGDINGAAGCLHVVQSTEPNMSFVRYGSQGEVIEVAEKRRISTWASVGMYGFRSSQLYRSLYEDAYHAKRIPTVRDERYIAPMYELLLRRGEDVLAPRLRESHVQVLGTPSQVITFDRAALPPTGSSTLC